MRRLCGALAGLWLAAGLAGCGYGYGYETTYEVVGFWPDALTPGPGAPTALYYGEMDALLDKLNAALEGDVQWNGEEYFAGHFTLVQAGPFEVYHAVGQAGYNLLVAHDRATGDWFALPELGHYQYYGIAGLCYYAGALHIRTDGQIVGPEHMLAHNPVDIVYDLALRMPREINTLYESGRYGLLAAGSAPGFGACSVDEEAALFRFVGGLGAAVEVVLPTATDSGDGPPATFFFGVEADNLPADFWDGVGRMQGVARAEAAFVEDARGAGLLLAVWPQTGREMQFWAGEGVDGQQEFWIWAGQAE